MGVKESKFTSGKAKEGSGSGPKDELARLYEETVKSFTEGEVVKGKIVAIRTKEVLVDIGYKSEGLLKLDEFSDPSSLKVGDEIEVLFEAVEDDNGMVILSKRKADRMRSWNDIVAFAEKDGVIEGKIFKKVRGGFMVDIGMEAFLPASLVDIKPTRNLDQFLGVVSKFKIVKVNPKRRNIVLSRKDYLEKEKETARAKMMETIAVGQLVKGTVKNITDFGAFIDLGGMDGLLHITDMRWGRISHPSEMLAIGDEVEVVIIGVDKEHSRVSLGLKQKMQDPWEEADKKYPVNSKVKGRVVNILPYGAFVELEKGIEGLVHISEFSWTKRVNHPSEVVAIGDVVEAIVLSIDKPNRKIALGIKQVEVNPWLLAEEKYEVGSKIEGKVKNLTDYGAFVELEPGIGGLIHVSDMSWTKKVTNPAEILKKGQKVEVKILSVDAANKKISLGLKQLEEDPWKRLTEKLLRGMDLSGKVTKIVNFGLFVEIGEGLEGLVHISEIPPEQAKNLTQSFKVGDPIMVRILSVDDATRKIALSIKDVEQPAKESTPEVQGEAQASEPSIDTPPASPAESEEDEGE